MHSDEITRDRIRLFAHSSNAVREQSSNSASIVSAALGIRSSESRTNYFQSQSNNKFHSQELTEIPSTVKVDPTASEDLRIVDLLDNGHSKPFLDFSYNV
jgi:inner membrane protein involved in colicin E2 resistance